MSVYDSVKYWLKEIDAAEKRAKTFRKEGKKLYDLYKGTGNKSSHFNILYSNTETLLPALYSDTPIPVISRKNTRQPNPLERASANAGELMLKYLIDTAIDEYEDFNTAMQRAVLDSLIVARGSVVVKYEAETGEDEIYYEHVCAESIAWDRMLFGEAKKWSKMPFVALEEWIDREEAVEKFGKRIAKQLNYTTGNEERDKELELNPEEGKSERKVCKIYQIWDREGGKKVRYVSDQYKDGFLRVDDDPLGITGFYPFPEPITLVANSDDFEPIPLYRLYEEQAEELNRISRSIKIVTRAIKVKGVYDAELKGDISQLFDGDELEMIPAEKPSALSAEKGFEAFIWFLPVEQLIKVLNQLYMAREQCKQTIYEITGISDIIRGSTVASETATAQSIKSQWGTMRLKRLQLLVQRYCRDTLRIMLDVAAQKMSVGAWAAVTGTELATDEQLAQAQMILQNAPQNPPPQLQQIIAQAQAITQKVPLSQVLAMLNNDLLRSYTIDIETNSTILPEATEDKENINEAINVLGRFMKEALPAVQMGYVPFESFKSVILKIMRQYQFGEDIETELDSLQPPQQPEAPPDNTLQIKQQELAAQQQLEQQKLEMHRVVEQGKASTQMHIEQMRAENSAKIEQMRNDNKIQIEQLKNAFAFELEKFRIESTAQPIEIQQQNPNLDAMIAKNEQVINEIMAVISKPKVITKTEEGYVIH